MVPLFHIAQGAIIFALLLVHALAFSALRTFLLAAGGYLGVARWRRRTGILARWCAVAIVAAGILAAVGLFTTFLSGTG